MPADGSAYQPHTSPVTIVDDGSMRVAAINTQSLDGCRLVRRALVMMGSVGFDHDLALTNLRMALARHRRAQARVNSTTCWLKPADTRRHVADAVMRVRLSLARIERAVS